MAPLTWVLIAFAFAVLIVAVEVLIGTPGSGQFFADLRAWARREPGTTGRHPLAEFRRELADEDDAGSVDSLFEIGQRAEDAYVDPIAVVRPLTRVARRASDVALGTAGTGRPDRHRPVAPDRLLR